MRYRKMIVWLVTTIVLIYSESFGYSGADFNYDGIVNNGDLAHFAVQWLAQDQYPGAGATAPGPGQFKCDQVQRKICASESWQTLFELTDGPAVITGFWLANDATSSARTSCVRITFDEAGSPQIIGAVAELFGASFEHNDTFRARFNGVTRNDSSHMAGYLRLLMPYYSSCRVEFYNAESPGTCRVWAMVERIPLYCPEGRLGPGSGMYLHTSGGEGYPAEYMEVTMLDTNEPSILAGVYQYINNGHTSPEHTAGHNFYYLEGDIRIYYDQEPTASYRSSGTEDFYYSSWYFSEGQFAEDDKVLATKDSSNHVVALNRFWRLSEAPYDPNGIKLTWQNGESVVGDPNEPYHRYIVWYYK